MKVLLILDNPGDYLMLGVPKETHQMEGRVTAVIIRKEVVPVVPTEMLSNLHTPYVDKAYIELEINGLTDTETHQKVINQIPWVHEIPPPR